MCLRSFYLTECPVFSIFFLFSSTQVCSCPFEQQSGHPSSLHNPHPSLTLCPCNPSSDFPRHFLAKCTSYNAVGFQPVCDIGRYSLPPKPPNNISFSRPRLEYREFRALLARIPPAAGFFIWFLGKESASFVDNFLILFTPLTYLHHSVASEFDTCYGEPCVQRVFEPSFLLTVWQLSLPHHLPHHPEKNVSLLFLLTNRT